MNNQQVVETFTENYIFYFTFSQSVVSAALRAVGNIVTGDDIQTQVIFCDLFISNEIMSFFFLFDAFYLFLDLSSFFYQVIINCGALPCLLQLLSAPKESIRKEVGGLPKTSKVLNILFCCCLQSFT